MTSNIVQLPGADHASTRGYPLTLAQKRIWSLGQIGNRSVFPTQLLALRWQGTGETGALVTALHRVADRHPALRMRFQRFAGGRVEQAATGALQVQRTDLAAVTAEARDAVLCNLLDAFAAPAFDLETGASARALVVRLGDDDHVVGIALHPIVCDP